VAALFEKEVEAGITYKIDFDATKLATGVYIYRFNTCDKTYSRKLIIAR